MKKIRQRLESMTMPELQAIAKRLGVKGYSNVVKPKLLDLLCSQEPRELRRVTGHTFIDRHEKRIGIALGIVGIVITIVLYILPNDESKELTKIPTIEVSPTLETGRSSIFDSTFDPFELKANFDGMFFNKVIENGFRKISENDSAMLRKDLLSAYPDDIVTELRAKAAFSTKNEDKLAFLISAEDHAPRNAAVAYELGLSHLLNFNHLEAQEKLKHALSERAIYPEEGYPEPLAIRSALATSEAMLGQPLNAAKGYSDVLETLRGALDKVVIDNPDEKWPRLDIGITVNQSAGSWVSHSPFTTKIDLLYLEVALAFSLLAGKETKAACDTF